jgi:hypothetical protein
MRSTTGPAWVVLALADLVQELHMDGGAPHLGDPAGVDAVEGWC